MKRTKAAEVIPTKPGTPFEGGIYMARFFDGVDAYALIVAPRAEGEFDSVTHAQAIKKAKALCIGSHKDWTMPTRLQALLLYQERDKLKSGEAFQPKAYWTSEQSASYSDFAWYQGFYYGYQYGTIKAAELRARAVRRFKI